jgi:DnaK suppressor protein
VAKKSAKAAEAAAPKVTTKATESKTAKPSSPPAAKKIEAAAPAKPVATGRPASKISTSDNMPPSPATKVDTKLANAWKNKAGRELSEAELLAMPEAEYMSDKQLDFFRARLEAQKDDLLSNAGETTEHLREDTSIVPDPADRATIEEEHALELRTRDRERKLLKKISQALTRIDSGEYGFCDETGEPIGLGRLMARPTATLSLEAQQRRELKQKMFGD